MAGLVALWDLQGEGGSRDLPKAQLQFSPDAWQRTRRCAQGQKCKLLHQHQLRYGTITKVGEGVRSFGLMRNISMPLATQIDLHVRLRRHLQTCQNTIHIRVQILTLRTLLVDVKALPRLAA